MRKGGEGRESSLLSWKQSKEVVDAESEEDAMSLKKRHIGRRVAGVGVGVALMVLGLQAPAFAAAADHRRSRRPVARTDCVVVVTGTGFMDFPSGPERLSTSWPVRPDCRRTLLTSSSSRTRRSGSSAPDLGRREPSYNLRVTNRPTADRHRQRGDLHSRRRGAGACAPTITSFTPTCGIGGRHRGDHRDEPAYRARPRRR